MSKTAVIILYAVAFIVSVVFAYGIGHKHGRHAQLSMKSVMEIVKAQYTCKLEQK